MSSPTNPTSRELRNSSQRLVFDVRPCRRAQLLWTLFGLAAAVALCFSVTPHPVWRVVAAAVALVLATLPSLAVLLGLGPWAVRHCEWGEDGRWHLKRPDGRLERARLTAATATLGPWVLLAWTISDEHRFGPFSGRYALIEESRVGSAAFRALRGRLALFAGRDSGPFGTVAP